MRPPSRSSRLFEGFDFTSVKLPPSLSRQELCSAAFIEEKRNLVLYGPVGTGKTHLATALGVIGCQMGRRTRFFTAAELVVRLSEAFAAGTLGEAAQKPAAGGTADYRRVGLRPGRQPGSTTAVSHHLRQLRATQPHSSPRTSSSPSGDPIFTDDQMAAAMIDRLAHHGYILLFEGESYRMKHALMRQKGQGKIPSI